MFELNVEDRTQVKDATHREIIAKRRGALIEYVGKLESIRSRKNVGFKTASEGLNEFITDLTEQLKLMVSDRLASPADGSSQFAAYRPINIFVQSPPGAGKSSLVRMLSRELRTAAERIGKLTEINCSNLSAYSELIPTFERLSVLHENGILPIAFFDEIDIPAWEAFQFMLMPMNEGAVISHGHPVKFGTAAFFFAASRQMTVEKTDAGFRTHDGREWIVESKDAIEEFAKSESAPAKFADFFSRIDLFFPLPGIRDHFVDAKLVNNVYPDEISTIEMLGQLIKRRFPQVQHVDKRVLIFLAGALPASKRELEKAVFQSTLKSSDVQFDFENLSKKALEGPWFKEVEKLDKSTLQLEFVHWTDGLWDLANRTVKNCGYSFTHDGEQLMQRFLKSNVPAGLTKCTIRRAQIGDELKQGEVGLGNCVLFVMNIVRLAQERKLQQISPDEINKVYNDTKQDSLWPFC